MSQELPTLDPLTALVDLSSEYMHASCGRQRAESVRYRYVATARVARLADRTGRAFCCDGSDRHLLATVFVPGVASRKRRAAMEGNLPHKIFALVMLMQSIQGCAAYDV